MASSKCRVSKEIILHIAEHCDLETLSTMMQTCKNLNSLIANFEHSISKAKIGASYQPPRDLVLSSGDEQRCTILDRNTFATVQELELRARRIDSLLNRSGFLLTSDPKILGMTSASLIKFKAGLHEAIYLADQLADLATQYPILEHTEPTSPVINTIINPTPANLVDTGFNTMGSLTAHHARLRQEHHAQRTLRLAQVTHLRTCTSRSLAWLVTLAAGGSKGFARYSERLLESDPAMADARIMAFKEVLLRHGGCLVLWSFMRGSGTMATFVRQAVSQCAEEVLFFEEYAHELAETEEDVEHKAKEMTGGLHMYIMEELNRRMVEERRAKAAEKGESFDGEVSTREVWRAIDTLVGKEVGCETWRGYNNIRYPA